MGCPGCGHSLYFDFEAGYPRCRHCRYPDPPDDKRLYTDAPAANDKRPEPDSSLKIDSVLKDRPGSENPEPGQA